MKLPPLRALRPVPFAVVLGLALRSRGVPVDASAPNRSEALARALGARGFSAQSTDVTWIDRERGGLFAHGARAVVRAAKGDDPPRLFVVDTRISPENVLLDASSPRPATRSSGVEETPPAVSGARLATVLVAGSTAVSLQLVDLGGEPRPEGPRWSVVKRLQNRVTNWQESGQSRGIGRRAFALVPPASRVALRFEGDDLVITADGREARVPQALGPGQHDAELAWLKPQPIDKGAPGNLVTWAVDRVRQSEWFGDEKMQYLKAVVFDAADVLSRTRSKVVSTDTKESAKEIQDEIGGDGGEPAKASETDKETGWPPPPVPPYLKTPVEGEGKWVLLEDDPFVRRSPGNPALFARTFIRTDRDRPYTRIHIALWDPRLVSLHTMGGSAEPTSATGSTAGGLVPRTPRSMRRLVAAFNGGFQALHGEFGMMSGGQIYLPPKPYAATVMELRDGSTATGVWPTSLDVPQEIVGFRQNLTPLVLDEKFNPYQRTWWGGTPPGWQDRVHTTRSGLCMTKEGFVGYFYGNGIGAEDLANAMIHARCKLGMHLDMNPGHTGLEFYSAAPESEWQPLGRAYQGDWESEGEVSGMSGDKWRFRGRRMVRGMGLMNFPRYIQREARDFFYLTMRPTLPGPDLSPPIVPAEPGEGKWRTKQLPQLGFPHAVATTTLRPDKARADARVRVLAIDPATVRLARPDARDDRLVVSLDAPHGPRAGEPTLYLSSQSFVISKEAPRGGVPLASGAATSAEAASAVGVDEDGHLLYVEAEGDAPAGALLDQALAALGCTSKLFFERSLTPLLAGTTTLSSQPGKHRGGHVVKLVRGEAPGARFLFPDTPIVPYAEWGPIQQKRIRYFKKAE